MYVYIVRDWNLNLIGMIKAVDCDDAQSAWEEQAANGRIVLATRLTAERAPRVAAEIAGMVTS